MYVHFLLVRRQLEEATKKRDKTGVAAGVRAETVFGGRLSDTNMVHARPLVGKAFARRFRKHLALLGAQPNDLHDIQTWRRVGTPPGAAELDRIWTDDKKLLGMD
jgi:hypothetical protein